MSLFDRLKKTNIAIWDAYTKHEFVRLLGEGILPEEAFRHYLVQDYLFLKHFARAYALAVYKSDSLEQMRQAAVTVSGILETEMELHRKLCAGWGIDPAQMEGTKEASATMAYTRYVLECGLAGDILDLHVALAPCVIGYAEIGADLAQRYGNNLSDNPYRAWIEEYASAEYQQIAEASRHQLDDLATKRMTPARFESLSEHFSRATRLEADFWQMGLDHG